MTTRLTVTARIIIVLLSAVVFATTACVKDHCKKTHSYTYFVPVYKSQAEVIASIKSNEPKAMEKTGKIYIYGKYIFLNEVDKGIHVIDNANPSSPKNISFIDIPGNVDLAVKENVLYADMYGDFVALDISDPRDVKLLKKLDDVFMERKWMGGFSTYRNGQVVVDWIRKDTVVEISCKGEMNIFAERGDVFFLAAANNSSKSVSPVGMGGSMARFTIVNDYLYTVDNHSMNVFSVSNASSPVRKDNIFAGFDIETIYPFKNTLFLGSMNGLYIFDISNPLSPVRVGEFNHARACDPVIADDKYAYVTLREGTNCGPAKNELLVLNVENLSSPSLVKQYEMGRPHGLAKDGDLLLICDGQFGLKVFNAAKPTDLKSLSTIGNIDTYDVIATNKIALVVAKDGLYQYDYSDVSNIRLLSKIQVNKP